MKQLIGLVLTYYVFIGGIFGQIDPRQVDFVKSDLNKGNFPVKDIYITDHYTSGGITHTYFRLYTSGSSHQSISGMCHQYHLVFRAVSIESINIAIILHRYEINRMFLNIWSHVEYNCT